MALSSVTGGIFLRAGNGQTVDTRHCALGIDLRRPEAWLGGTNVALTDVESSGT